MQLPSVLRWALLVLPLLSCCDAESNESNGGSDGGSDGGSGGGSDGGSDGCRAKSECASGEECLGPNEWSVCGIPPQEQCADDEGCQGQTCHAIGDSCSRDGTGSSCGHPCNDDCEPGYRCNAGGACEAIPCDEGFACQAHQVCDPTSVTGATPVYDRHHGCVDIDCGGDGDCPSDLVCVNGMCQVSLGTCGEPEQAG